MATLSSLGRKQLPRSSFGLPGKRKYPMPDKEHAAERQGPRDATGQKGATSRGRLKSGSTLRRTGFSGAGWTKQVTTFSSATTRRVERHLDARGAGAFRQRQKRPRDPRAAINSRPPTLERRSGARERSQNARHLPGPTRGWWVAHLGNAAPFRSPIQQFDDPLARATSKT